MGYGGSGLFGILCNKGEIASMGRMRERMFSCLLHEMLLYLFIEDS